MIFITLENKVDNQEPRTKPRICGRATDSLILGILIIVPGLGTLFGLGAIIMGVVALSRIKRSLGKLYGRGLAIAGIVLGIVGGVLLPAVSILYFYDILILPKPWASSVAEIPGLGMIYGATREATARSKVSRAKADLRMVATALEQYHQEYGSYPAWAMGDAGANSFAGPKAGVYHIPTFRIWQRESEVGRFYTLTTPVAYITSYPADPWANTRGATFGYYSDENGWILFSWGPDRDENKRDSWDLAPDVERVYKSSVSQPSFTLIAGTSSSPAHEAYTYDPTNGTISPGDIWRVKQ